MNGSVFRINSGFRRNRPLASDYAVGHENHFKNDSNLIADPDRGGHRVDSRLLFSSDDRDYRFRVLNAACAIASLKSVFPGQARTEQIESLKKLFTELSLYSSPDVETDAMNLESQQRE